MGFGEYFRGSKESAASFLLFPFRSSRFLPIPLCLLQKNVDVILEIEFRRVGTRKLRSEDAREVT
jgi:hypothetical protein